MFPNREHIEGLWDAAKGSEDAEKLDLLATLVNAYEAVSYPVGKSDPIELIEYAIGELGRTREELVAIVGSRSHASEILNRIRLLSLEMIRKISAAWHLPVGLLIAPYELKNAKVKVRPKNTRNGKAAAKRP